MILAHSMRVLGNHPRPCRLAAARFLARTTRDAEVGEFAARTGWQLP